MSEESIEKVERTDVGYSYTVELKRGSDTRDQDNIVGKIKTETYEDLRAGVERMKADMRADVKDFRTMQDSDADDD